MPGLRTFRPSSLDRFPKRDTMPVVVWGNGGCAIDITLGADPRVGTIGVFNSGVQERNSDAPPSSFPTSDALKKLHGPVLLINGHERDFMMARSKATYDAIESLRLSTARGTALAIQRRHIILVAASLRTSRGTG